MFGAISDVASKVAPPPFSLIFKVCSMAFNLIDGIIGEAKQDIYEYSVNCANGRVVKYYWDGGLTMNYLFGLVPSTERGIDSLQLVAPIEITRARNADQIYFNGEIFSDEMSAKSKAIQYLTATDNLDSHASMNFKKVYSLEPQNRLNPSNCFDQIYDPDYHNQNTLTQYTIRLAKEFINSSGCIHNQFFQTVQDELFFNGFHFNNLEEFRTTYETKILDKIQPVYIAQIPELDSQGYPLSNDKLSKFRLPYPYYDPNSRVDNDSIIDEPQNNQHRLQYITYNSNTSGDVYHLSQSDIINLVSNSFRASFKVQDKFVLKNSMTNDRSFDNLPTSVYNVPVYYVELKQGQPKYFLDKDMALNYVNKMFLPVTGDSYRMHGDLQNVLTIKDSHNQKLYFKNQAEFKNWFDQNVIAIKD